MGCVGVKGARWRLMHRLVILTFLIRRINYILFLRYLGFCAFVNSTNFKTCDIIIGIASSGISTYDYSFSILNTLNNKFDQMLVCCRRNISNKFLIQDWKWETSSMSFYDFVENAI